MRSALRCLVARSSVASLNMSNILSGDFTSGAHIPLWLRGVTPPRYSKLTSDVDCDVCIVGGGIAGVSAAYHLSSAGQKVVLLEDGELASGETGRSTAHLMSKLDDHFSVLSKHHGVHGASLAYASHAAAIDVIERTVADHRIDCGFERIDGYLFPGNGVPSNFIDTEYAAGESVGVRDMRLLPRAPIAAYDTGPSIVYGRQGMVDPVRYLYGLARAATALGADIYTHTRAATIEGSRAGAACVTTPDGVSVRARFAIEATNVPGTNLLRLHAKQKCTRYV